MTQEVDEEIKRMSTAFESEQLGKIMQQLNTQNQEESKNVDQYFEQLKKSKTEKRLEAEGEIDELDKELLQDQPVQIEEQKEILIEQEDEFPELGDLYEDEFPLEE